MKSIGPILFIFVFSIFFSTKDSLADEYRRFGQDYRAMAMGNTGISSATNSSALFYNPAAMAGIQSWWFDLPMAEVSYTDEAKGLINEVRTGDFKLETQDEIISFMEDMFGKKPYVKVDLGSNLFVNFNKKGFTLGGNYTYEAILDIEVRNPSLPEIDAFFRLDFIRQVGFSLPVGLGKWVIGGTYKSLERTEMAVLFDMQQALNNEPFPSLKEGGVTGSGTGYDLGFLYRFANQSRMVMGGVWRKKIIFDNEDVISIPEEIALGFSMTHEFGIFKWVAAMDFRDITTNWGSEDDKSYNRRIHYGTELGIFPITDSTSFITLRAGSNQGYPSGGAEIAFFGHSMIIGYTRYTEETGEYAGQKPSARKVAYLSFGF